MKLQDAVPKLALPYNLNQQDCRDLIHVIEQELGRTHYSSVPEHTPWRKRLRVLKARLGGEPER